MEEENVVVDNSNTTEEEVLETSQEEYSEQEEGEDVDEFKERLAKAKQLANNYKIRAEKAERLARGSKTEANPKQSNEFNEDMYALLEAKVAKDDIQEVRDYARLKNISVAEALKSSIVKSILSEKQEQRNVASASNVGTSKRSSGKITEEMLLENVKRGVLPETDEDIMLYAKAKKS